jgi:hypothetical protein
MRGKDFRYSCIATAFSFVVLCVSSSGDSELQVESWFLVVHVLVPALGAIPKVLSKSGFTAWVLLSLFVLCYPLSPPFPRLSSSPSSIHLLIFPSIPPHSIYSFRPVFLVVFWPVWEARNLKGLAAIIARGIVNDISGKGLVNV